MTQLKDGGRQPSNREERPLSASTVIARGQGNGEPCKSRGLRTVLWAAGGEIPPADPATGPAGLAAHAPTGQRQLGSRRFRSRTASLIGVSSVYDTVRGEVDRDGGPDIRGAFQFQIAAVELHQGTAQRKAKARALVRAG